MAESPCLSGKKTRASPHWAGVAPAPENARMKVSNTQTIIICYLTPQEVEHLGGYNTKVTLKMSAYQWTIHADRHGDKSVCSGGRSASLEYPGRVNARSRSDIPQFGATVWPTRLAEGRTVVATVGSMAQPVRETGKLARQHRLNRALEQEKRVRAGQDAALARHALMESMAAAEKEPDTAPAVPSNVATRKISLSEAIEAVNRHKDRMGDELVLEIKEGYLSAVAAYGRRRE